jgi:hypothetical protein
MTQHFIAFPVNDTLLSNSNRFFEAVAARDPIAGKLFSDIMQELTRLLIDTLLLHPMSMTKMSSMMEKVVKLCASTGMKVSGMLAGKLYDKAPWDELEKVATVWQAMLRDYGDGKGWRIGTELSAGFATRLEALLQERGTDPVYYPKDINIVVQAYEQLAEVVIDDIFLRPSSQLTIGRITDGLKRTGVSSVKAAIQSVMHNVIAKLPPEPLTGYIDYTTQFYVKTVNT